MSVAEAATAIRFGAGELAERLGLPAPTPEQRAIIESPLGVSLVVAGAGSGKTETMAARVVWLVANGLVPVDGVLGLTFTRKAAGELAARIRTRLRQLTRAGVLDLDPVLTAEVSTYNAFASGVFREHALRIGRDPDAELLGEAGAWQLTRRIAVHSQDARLSETDKGLDAVTRAVLSLSRAMSENEAHPQAVADEAAALARVLPSLPAGSTRIQGVSAQVRRTVEDVGALPLLVGLAEAYRDEKHRRGLIEFADQVAFAHEIVRAAPDVVADLRARYPVVILDEYQDTSVGQTRLLSALFGAHPVMAVGDPNQSIYGWRGASAANLAGFRADFADPDAPVFPLSTSWRNPRSVLAAANRLALPLAADLPIAVRPLRPAPAAGDGAVEVRFEQTVREEAAAIAVWLRSALDDAPASPPTMAVLCRTLKGSSTFTAALADAGVPYRVLGLGGLLDRPAVADLVCALRAMHSADAGPELVRLLTGARFRVGTADVWHLSRVARWLARRDADEAPLDEATVARMRASVAAGEAPSLVDALDFVATRPGHPMLAAITDVGRARMQELGTLLGELRRRRSGGVVDTVAATIRALRLDIETAANETQPTASADLDELLAHAAAYQATDPGASLGAFLGWLEEAEQRENLAPRSEPAEPGTVQVLTVHGAKGLEWDLVVVPRVVVDEFPAASQSNRGWTAYGELPAMFRLDAAQLPGLDWRSADSQAGFNRLYREYTAEVKAHHAAEQRRLAYVAVTRARDRLLLTGSFWSTQKKPRPPSEYLDELVGAGLLPELPSAPDGERVEGAVAAGRVAWPLDPLGARRERVQGAADQVRAADAGALTPWSEEIAALLAERDAAGGQPPPPARIAASRFEDWIGDAHAVAAELARPMPQRPHRRSRLGTVFHAWVEHRAGVTHAAELLDDGPFADAGVPWQSGSLSVEDEQRLEHLQANFAAGPWGDRQPDEVELEIQLPFADRVVVCRIDAIFRTPGARGAPHRWQIVDWKTGAPPVSAAERESRELQLALYRLAFSEWRDVPLESIDAALYYVAENLVIRPERSWSRAALEGRWRDALG